MMKKPIEERDREVLSELYGVTVESSQPIKWAIPLDIGAWNGSHHSATLARLAKRGLVQFKQRHTKDPPDGDNGKHPHGWSRGSKCYRLTPEGIALMQKKREARMTARSGTSNKDPS